jgi:peptide/nickel transport system substrate-binding protein
MIGLAAAASVLLALAAETAAGQPGGSASAKIQRGGTLIAARAADAVLWDPAHINENDSLWAANQTNANLIMVTPDGKGFQPYVAKSWTISKSGRVFTFHIFPNAKFCDGSPITAQDVAFSFARASKKNAIVSWQYPQWMRVKTVGT